MHRVPLWHTQRAIQSRGKYALVDDDDLEVVLRIKWSAVHVSDLWYAQHSRGGRRPDGDPLMMHRLILGVSQGEKIDHIDGNGLNNQRTNLRIATTSQNGMNSSGKIHARSGRFKGVMWEKDRGLYSARIKVNGVYLNLGRFRTDTAGAWAYDQAAREHYGEFARVNGVSDPGDDGTVRRPSYSRETKLAVMQMAETEGAVVAIETFGVSQWTFYDWLKKYRAGTL